MHTSHATMASGGPRGRRPAAWVLALLPLFAAPLSMGGWWLRRDLAAFDYGRGIMKSLPRSKTIQGDLLVGSVSYFSGYIFSPLRKNRKPAGYIKLYFALS